jgi:hypothetical protein
MVASNIYVFDGFEYFSNVPVLPRDSKEAKEIS